MEKADMATKVLEQLCAFLARQNLIDQQDATDIVGGLMEAASDRQDFEALEYFERFEKIMFNHASPRRRPGEL